MTEPSTIIPPVEPDPSLQVSAVRYAALGLAAIALVGLVVWYVTSGNETRQESAAALTRASELQRSLFREEGGRLYVSLPAAVPPENGAVARQPSPGEFVRRNDAPAIVASLPPPERNPPPLPAPAPVTEPTPAQPSPDSASANEPTPAPSTSDEPHKEMAAKPARAEPRFDEPMAAGPTPDDRTADEPAPPEQMSDETSDDTSSSESMRDEPPEDAMMDEPSEDGPTSDDPPERDDD